MSVRGVADDLRRAFVKGGHGLAERVSKLPGRSRLSPPRHFNMKIVSKHIIKGAVRVYIAEPYCSRMLSRDISKFVQKKTRTCGICITSFER